MDIHEMIEKYSLPWNVQGPWSVTNKRLRNDYCIRGVCSERGVYELMMDWFINNKDTLDLFEDGTNYMTDRNKTYLYELIELLEDEYGLRFDSTYRASYTYVDVCFRDTRGRLFTLEFPRKMKIFRMESVYTYIDDDYDRRRAIYLKNVFKKGASRCSQLKTYEKR